MKRKTAFMFKNTEHYVCTMHMIVIFYASENAKKWRVSQISGISWTENVSLSHHKQKNMTKVKTKNIDSSIALVWKYEQTCGKHEGHFGFAVV